MAKKNKKHASEVEISPDRFDEMRAALQKRVKASRYLHSMGVSQTAEQLARIYGANENDAAVAGLLHDWDKSLTSKELKRKAKKLKLAKKSVRENATGVLHAWTAAATLKEVFPDLNDAVLSAISKHTCAALDMSDLDMVVYVADIIEPGRDFPDIEGLRDAVGKVCLEELFYRTYKANLLYLLSADMVVAPPSLDVYNAFSLAHAKREAEQAAALEEDAAQDAQSNDTAQSADGMAEIVAEHQLREQLAAQANKQIELAQQAARQRAAVREQKRAEHLAFEEGQDQPQE